MRFKSKIRIERTNRMLDIFKRFALDYELNNVSTVDDSQVYHRLMTKELPERVTNIVGSRYLVKGSCGQGNKTSYPWMAIMHPSMSRSAQKGLYVVFIFRSDLKGFYLKLSQGITFFQRQYGKKKYDYAQQVADYFRSQIESPRFSKSEPDLNTKKNDLGYGYEKTNIISKYYDLSLTHENLQDDLLEMMTIYDNIRQDIEPMQYDDVIRQVLHEEPNDLISVDEADHLIRKALAKHADTDIMEIVTLQRVDVPHTTRSFTRVTREVFNKTDYIAKAKKDMDTGLHGEKLVIAYEKSRLEQIGLSEYATQIKWVSKESDHYGYDIKSYDLINGQLVPRYIEVKTTVLKKDAPFIISRNEVSSSIQLEDHYWVYRVFDAESKTPKVYCIHGNIEDHFELTPINYMAKVKY